MEGCVWGCLAGALNMDSEVLQLLAWTWETLRLGKVPWTIIQKQEVGNTLI
jgi:hypothetical protein